MSNELILLKQDTNLPTNDSTTWTYNGQEIYAPLVDFRQLVPYTTIRFYLLRFRRHFSGVIRFGRILEHGGDIIFTYGISYFVNGVEYKEVVRIEDIRQVISESKLTKSHFLNDVVFCGCGIACYVYQFEEKMNLEGVEYSLGFKKLIVNR